MGQRLLAHLHEDLVQQRRLVGPYLLRHLPLQHREENAAIAAVGHTIRTNARIVGKGDCHDVLRQVYLSSHTFYIRCFLPVEGVLLQRLQDVDGHLDEAARVLEFLLQEELEVVVKRLLHADGRRRDKERV